MCTLWERLFFFLLNSKIDDMWVIHVSQIINSIKNIFHMGYFKSQRQITLSRSKSLRSRFDFGLEYHGSEGSIFTCMHSVIILLSYVFISKKKKWWTRNKFIIYYADYQDPKFIDILIYFKSSFLFYSLLGIAVATSIFGPAIAFGIGGYFSRMYVTLEGKWI